MFDRLKEYRRSHLYRIDEEVQVIEYIDSDGLKKTKKRIIFRPVRKAPTKKVTVLKDRKDPFIPLFEE